jgi:hypothetical protein
MAIFAILIRNIHTNLMNLSTRLVVGLLSLCVPFAVAAAAPGNVTGIKASLQGGKVLVTWTPVTDQHIASYRVFFGHQSILSSNGSDDDYDTVDGSVNSYAIVNTPNAAMVYVSVLATNDQGEESPYFAEEASVKLNGNGQQASSAIMNTAQSSSVTAMTMTQSSATMTLPTTTNSILQLLAVRALSATGVELTFSASVAVDPSIAVHAFDIRSGSGKELPLTRLSIQGNTVRIDTVPQERGVVYAVILGAGITGTDAVTGGTMVLDPAQAPMLFTGHPNGIAPVTDMASSSPSSSSSSAPTAALPSDADVQNLALRAQPEGKGFYTMQATWLAPNDATLIGFQVTQTTDRGMTYSQPNNLPATTNSVSIPHVPAGNYGLMVRAVYDDGTMSPGVLRTVELAGAPTSPLTGSVTGKPTLTHLPQSGPGAWMLVLIMGSALGYAGMKRFSHVDMAKA